MVNRIKAIIKKEFRQIVRDKGTLGVLLFVPLFLLIMFGYAISLDIKNISLAVIDRDRSPQSRELIRNFLNSEYFELYAVLEREGDIDPLLDTEAIGAAIIIPSDFSQNIINKKDAEIQVLVDGANGNTASTAMGYISAIASNYTHSLFIRTLQKTGFGTFKPAVELKPRVLFNPELKSANFLVPGLIVLILMMTSVMSTALAIVREKELGTMEQISVSPLRPIELIIGKTVPYLLVSVFATVTILLSSYILFGVTIRGNYFLLAGITLLFITGCLGLGILISTVAQTQQVAFLISVMATLLPTYILSGFVFPIRNMPEIIQIFTYILPGRYYLQALRNIILKGTGLEACWDQVIGLVVFVIVTVTASVMRLSGKGKAHESGKAHH